MSVSPEFAEELIAGRVSLLFNYKSYDGECYAIMQDGVQSDWDDDGLTNHEETNVWGTQPFVRDSDGDGLLDGEEALRLDLCAKTSSGCDPAKKDTDGDGLADGLEVGLTEVDLDARKTINARKSIGATACEDIASGIVMQAAGVTGANMTADYKSIPEGLALCEAGAGAWTDPSKGDTDGDGYWDGGDVWATLETGACRFYIGEDRNCDGWYDRVGADGLHGTADDESDPTNIDSQPESGGGFVCGG